MSTKTYLGVAAGSTAGSLGGGYAISLAVADNSSDDIQGTSTLGNAEKPTTKVTEKLSTLSNIQKLSEANNKEQQNTQQQETKTNESTTVQNSDSPKSETGAASPAEEAKSSEALPEPAVPKITYTKPNNVVVFGKDNKLDPKYKNGILNVLKQDNLDYIVKPLENESYWNWAYQDLYSSVKSNKKELDEIFQGLDSSYSNQESDKSLNQACEKAYKDSAFDFENVPLLIKNIRKFCTKDVNGKNDVLEPKVETYEQAPSEYNTGILTLKENKGKLVKTSETNKHWWKWAISNLSLIFDVNEDDDDDDNVNIDDFYFTVLGYLDVANGGKTALNQACHHAYKKSLDQISNLSKKDLFMQNVKLFCTPGNKSDETIKFSKG